MTSNDRHDNKNISATLLKTFKATETCDGEGVVAPWPGRSPVTRRTAPCHWNWALIALSTQFMALAELFGSSD